MTDESQTEAAPLPCDRDAAPEYPREGRGSIRVGADDFTAIARGELLPDAVLGQHGGGVQTYSLE